MAKTTVIANILYVSKNGAKLVAAKGKAAWVMSRQVRADGSLTDGAILTLANSDMTEKEARKKYAEMLMSPEDKEVLKKQRKEEFKKKQSEPVSILVPRQFFQEYTDSSYKVRTNDVQKMYGKLCHVWTYVPKTKCVVDTECGNGNVKVTMPRWLYEDKLCRTYKLIENN